ncbi:PREDICTED: peamaclein-like [Nelumbo nucifera]|uniref:Peamaclein-like n=1 Tax=Nelumbo nucifera TaxID=4432 RepID=A0A1U8AU97_NELNU|nr:PREDICTED: peamaclein-like [Nelumbo nucifera]
MKLVLAVFLLVSLILSSYLLEATAQGPSLPDYTGLCTPKCNGRCSKAGYQDRCMKYCMICCQDCKCVPSGTYGNKHECPCYRDKKNNKGKPKCP